MRLFKRILAIIFNPLGSLYFPYESDKIVKKTNRHEIIIYAAAAILTVVIILIAYRTYIFK